MVFSSIGMLTALSGILYASPFKSATTTAGTLFELDAIAAAFVGDISPFVISYQYILRALVLVAAVLIDVATRNRKKS
jgi:putative multiple sugar transport system permease protein